MLDFREALPHDGFVQRWRGTLGLPSSRLRFRKKRDGHWFGDASHLLGGVGRDVRITEVNALMEELKGSIQDPLEVPPWNMCAASEGCRFSHTSSRCMVHYRTHVLGGQPLGKVELRHIVHHVVARRANYTVVGPVRTVQITSTPATSATISLMKFRIQHLRVVRSPGTGGRLYRIA